MTYKMKFQTCVILIICLLSNAPIIVAQSINHNNPIVGEDVLFEEENGKLVVEAEYFYFQSNIEKRQWYRTFKGAQLNVGRDEDEQHYLNASNDAYIEVLPDERVTHADKLMAGENFSNEPGQIAVVHYKVKINTVGRYYVWVRAFSTGSEDNGIHVGINNTWPESGKRMQWCEGKNNWTWASKQRTKEVHCGVPHQIYLDVDKPGVHNIQFSMREDGFEFDKFILTTDVNYVPIEKGPSPITSNGVFSKRLTNEDNSSHSKSYFTRVANSLSQNLSIPAQQFPINETNFYKNGKNWLAINPKEHQEATTSTQFNFDTGNYDLIFVGVGENDGSSEFEVFKNNKLIGNYKPPLSLEPFEEGERFNLLIKNIRIKRGDIISVKAKIGSADGKEHTRGRWAGIIFAPKGKGQEIQNQPSSYTSQ